MRRFCFLVWALLTVALAGLRAAPAAAIPDAVVFSGRWDLRDPARAITVNSGSHLRARFTGSSIRAAFDTAPNQPPLPTLAWRIDGGAWRMAEIAPALTLAKGLPAGPHTLWLMVRGLDEHQSRWNPPLASSVTFLGLQPGDGGRLLPPLDRWIHPKLKLEFFGDSITEGVLVQPDGLGKGKTSWAWKADALHSYACRTALALDADWRQVGFGASGLIHGGSGGVPAAGDSFDSFYAGCPRDGWQPDVVVINQGTNDGASPSFQPLYAAYLARIRQAYPQARIVALRPFNGNRAAEIAQAVTEAKAKGDQAIDYIDTTGWYSAPEPLHPNAAAGAAIAKKLVAALRFQGIVP